MRRTRLSVYAALLALPPLSSAQDTAASRSQAELAREADSIRSAYADSLSRDESQPVNVPGTDTNIASPVEPASGGSSPPCAVGKVLETCRENMLQTALERLMGTLKDPYSAKLDSEFIVTREEVPVVCGRVNAKNSFGGYTGKKLFVYWLMAGTDVVFLDDAAKHWNREQVLKAGKRCAASAPDETMRYRLTI